MDLGGMCLRLDEIKQRWSFGDKLIRLYINLAECHLFYNPGQYLHSFLFVYPFKCKRVPQLQHLEVEQNKRSPFLGKRGLNQERHASVEET